MNNENKAKNSLYSLFAMAIGLITAVSGLLVLYAWRNDLATLKTLGLGNIPVKSMAGLCFLMIGASLVLLQFPIKTTVWFIRFFSVIIFVIGAISFFEHVFFIDLGIDDILYRDVVSIKPATGQIRIAVNTSICSMLTATVLFLLSLKRIKLLFIIELYFVLIFSISFLGLTGFAFGLSEFSMDTGFMNMATAAALLFLLICISLYYTYITRVKVSVDINQKFFAGIIFAAIVVIFVTLISNKGFQALHEASERVEHSQAVKNNLNKLLTEVVDVEAGIRGYLLSQNNVYLEPMDKARDDLPGSIRNLTNLLQNDSLQTSRLQRLGPLIQERVRLAEMIQAAIQSGGTQAGMDLFNTGQGKKLTDEIRKQINIMREHENRLLTIRNNVEVGHARKAQNILFINLLIQLVLLAVIYNMIIRNINQRRQAISEIKQLNKNLENRVRDRTVSLAKSEERFRATLDNMLEGCQIIGSDWRYLYLNNVADIHNRRPKEEFLGNKYTDMWPGIEQTEFFSIIKHCMQEQVSHHLENQFFFPDGTEGWFDLSIQPVPEGVFILSIDITNRKKAELEIRKVNRVYAVLSNINQSIVRIKNLHDLFDETCRIAVDDGKFRTAWIGLADKDSGSIVPKALAGFSGAYIKSLNPELNLQNPCENPTVQVLHSGKHFIVNDIITHPSSSCNELAINEGYKSLGAFPLKIFKETIGVIMLCSDDRFFFDESEIKLLDEMAMDISFAIEFNQNESIKKKAEESLRESEERFRSIMENSADAIFITDQNGKYLYTNREVTNMLGYSPEEMKEMTIADLAPRDKIGDYLNTFSQLMITGKLYIEIDLLKKNGDLISVDLNSVLLQGDMVYGSCRDITERKRTEQELMKHRHHLEELVEERTRELRLSMDETRDLYENAPCGYHSIDADGKIVRMNNTELSWLGYTREEVIGKMKFIDFLTPEGLKTFKKNFPIFIKQGEIRNLEFELIRKDGSTFFVTVNGSAIYDNKGDFVMSRSTLFDITKRKTVEEAWKKAKQEADNANKAKSEFLANMSHEIRTPLNAVLGYTDLLSSTIADPVQKDYVNSIKTSGRSLLKLINDILDLSKIEAGKLNMEYDFVDTRLFFSEFERIFSLKIAEKELAFILELNSGTPQGIYIDESRLRQIVFNLIGNAIKFTADGTISLRIYAENPQIVNYSKTKTEEIIDLIIEVQDTGIGISGELLEAIFEPFVQEREYKKYGGTGLGLAITRRLTMLMNGTITVQSELGKGSKFTVRIPEITYLRDFSKTNVDIHIDPAAIIFERAVVLVVDDVEYNRNYIRDALKNTSLKILHAEDGVVGYEIAQKNVPDLIIADIRMPRLDGFGLLNKLKTNKKLFNIPVIAYSASVLRSQKEQIENSKFAGLLIKPVNITELYLVLMSILPYKSIPQSEPAEQTPEASGKASDLPGLRHALETTFFNNWKSFSVKQPIGEIREFGKKLVELGMKHNSDIVAGYGREIETSANNFNIKTMLTLIGKYEEIVQQFKP
jgi:PAS domain S-box-containing protein